ncbi:MAG: hypothetical protein AAF532_14450, partial [Planctomycetota bacterium]
MSDASNLVAGDTNGERDIFLRDRLLGTTEIISVDSSGSLSTGGGASSPTISDDGNLVVFTSLAADLTSDPNDANIYYDVFLRDVAAGTTTLVSKSLSGAGGAGVSDTATISGNGRYVVYRSTAEDLVSGDTNGKSDIFRYDVSTGVTELISVNDSGAQGNDFSHEPTVSDDGRVVGFSSKASNLAGTDLNGNVDAFVFSEYVTMTLDIVDDPGGSQLTWSDGVATDTVVFNSDGDLDSETVGGTNVAPTVTITAGSPTNQRVAAVGDQLGIDRFLVSDNPGVINGTSEDLIISLSSVATGGFLELNGIGSRSEAFSIKLFDDGVLVDSTTTSIETVEDVILPGQGLNSPFDYDASTGRLVIDLIALAELPGSPQVAGFDTVRIESFSGSAYSVGGATFVFPPFEGAYVVNSGVLELTGTAADDVIRVGTDPNGYVTINDVSIGILAASITSLRVDAAAGDDTIEVLDSFGTKTAVLIGGDGADRITGGLGDDEIYFEEVDLSVDARGGTDTLRATGTSGLGSSDGIAFDVAAANAEVVYGTDAADKIDARNIVVVPGVACGVSIYGGAGDDEIHGSDCEDLIQGGEGNDTIYGEAGMDELIGVYGANEIYGGLGDDRIVGGEGGDKLYGEAGVDEIHGLDGDDFIQGGEG